MGTHRIISRRMIIAVAVASLVGCGGGDDGNGVALAPISEPPSAEAACRALLGKTLADGEIASAELIAAGGTGVPEHCYVTGRMAGSEINFNARLPTAWNGKARMGASGGWQGTLTNGYYPAGSPSPLSKGYVDYTTDSGHTGKDPAGAAFDVSWAGRPGALENFAGLAHQRVTLAVQAIINAHYGRDVQRTYFEGCSGGGHIALLMAQRYPRLFDGIVAGAPAPNFVGTFLGWQRPAKALAVSGALPSKAQLTTLSKAVLRQCDKLDGVEDGIVSNPLACSFDPEPLRCTGAQGDHCLTDAQMNLAKELTTDTRYTDGSLLVKGLRFSGQEDDPANWLQWSTPLPGVPGNPSLFKAATASVIKVLTQNPDVDPLVYSIADDEANIRRLSARIDAWPGDLSAFGAAGRKLIVWNGTADTPVPFENQVEYHNSAVASLGGPANAQQTIKTYFPPGVAHCGGGAGAGVTDYLEALDNWVTNNDPPDGRKIAKLVNGSEVMSRPLCAYPTYPRYKGSGDVNQASSFVCTPSS